MTQLTYQPSFVIGVRCMRTHKTVMYINLLRLDVFFNLSVFASL